MAENQHKKMLDVASRWAYYRALRECYKVGRIPFEQDVDQMKRSARVACEKAINDIQEWRGIILDEKFKEDMRKLVSYDYDHWFNKEVK